jgi:hypothetical protein
MERDLTGRRVGFCRFENNPRLNAIKVALFCLRCHAIEALVVQNSNNMWGNYQVFAFLQTIVRGTTIYLVDWLIISVLLSSWLLNLVFIDTSHHLVGGF